MSLGGDIIAIHGMKRSRSFFFSLGLVAIVASCLSQRNSFTFTVTSSRCAQPVLRHIFGEGFYVLQLVWWNDSWMQRVCSVASHSSSRQGELTTCCCEAKEGEATTSASVFSPVRAPSFVCSVIFRRNAFVKLNALWYPGRGAAAHSSWNQTYPSFPSLDSLSGPITEDGVVNTEIANATETNEKETYNIWPGARLLQFHKRLESFWDTDWLCNLYEISLSQHLCYFLSNLLRAFVVNGGKTKGDSSTQQDQSRERLGPINPLRWPSWKRSFHSRHDRWDKGMPAV